MGPSRATKAKHLLVIYTESNETLSNFAPKATFKQMYSMQQQLQTIFLGGPTSHRVPWRRLSARQRMVRQGRLKIWAEHSTLILLISIPCKVAQQKFQHFYNSARNEFSPNLKGVAQKLGLPCPFEILDVFCGKSKSKAPRAFKFGTK